ncbi:MAG: restriction endonuclease subunit S [Holdemanella porci]|uniref:restriction endonuclease subunit S n=1 Tax=Holdemanella TaxID=1573535 RepID=UPI0039959AB3
MENNKTPSIRFKGFTDPWEQRKLLSCIEKITDFRGRTPKKLGMDWSESGYLALSALNVKDGYIDFSQDVHYGEQALYDKWMSGNELHKGQVLFTTEAPMGNVAQVPDNKRYILSQRTIAFDVKEDIITENFLATLLRSPAVFNTLTSLSSGGTAKGVSQKSLAGVDIQIPVELREQELLATYFANLDNLITLHQRKYNKLLNVKKSMLEKMFPKNGSNIPEIRFKGFTDPWEQRKLLSCIEKITDFRGRTPKKLGMDWSESGYLALSALNVKDGYIDFSQDVHYGEQALYDKWMSGNELHKGQVLFTTEAPMGNVAQVPDNKRYILSQRTIAFDVKEDIITENFLATLLRSPAVFNTLTSLSSGGTAKGVSQKSLAGVDIQIPVELREQELLATYFANLDNLITLHQRELEKLQNIKKSMLEKMFV